MGDLIGNYVTIYEPGGQPSALPNFPKRRVRRTRDRWVIMDSEDRFLSAFGRWESAITDATIFTAESAALYLAWQVYRRNYNYCALSLENFSGDAPAPDLSRGTRGGAGA